VGVHDRFVGEPGNDDLGAMSARYVWASLGLYPSVPGTPTLTVNTPLFDKVEIALPADKSIKGISAAAVSGKFDAGGSGTSTVSIKVADSVRAGYYQLVLTTKAGKGKRTFMLLNVVGDGG
jgi:hypothetical protein